MTTAVVGVRGVMRLEFSRRFRDMSLADAGTIQQLKCERRSARQATGVVVDEFVGTRFFMAGDAATASQPTATSNFFERWLAAIAMTVL
ncbi:hypothetical protein [Mycolicibacterium vulneris]|nr:hypothetical protein [Mycolicibacterium vulneris]